MDGIKAAYGRMSESAEASNDDSESGGKHESAEGGSQLQSVQHINHGKTHSVHKISKEGKAESSSHGEGEGEACPLCGK
jgi:hypothetical protein